MAVLAASLFMVPLAPAAMALGLLACGVGGLVPAACFALVPASVPRPDLVSPAMGLTIQGNNLMQLLAPPIMGLLAGFSWSLVAVPVLLGGGVAAWIGLVLGRTATARSPASPGAASPPPGR
jgi:hypothetical protein